MLGFWFQKGFDLAKAVETIMPQHQSNLSEIEQLFDDLGMGSSLRNKSQLFHATIAVEDGGRIRDTVIVDQNGPASLTEGVLSEGLLVFNKTYFDWNSSISYRFSFNESEGYYDGGFNGHETGPGKARCYLFTPSVSFLKI